MNERPWMWTHWPIRCKLITCNAARACGGLRAPRGHEEQVSTRCASSLFGDPRRLRVESVSSQASSAVLLPPPSQLISSLELSSQPPPHFTVSSFLQGRAFSHTRQPPLFPSSPLHFNLSERNRVLPSAAHRRLFGLRPFPDTFDLHVLFPLSLFLA